MRKIIDQILEGDFDYEGGSLDFSCPKIELSMLPGEVYEGSFLVHASSEGVVSGQVISSDLRMECLTEELSGNDDEIFYRFRGENLEEGEVIKGNFYIISSLGEYYIPFVVNAEYNVMESSVGPVKNLFHFANLAKSNWQEAVKLFYSPQFVSILSGRDRQYLDPYRALSAVPRSEPNVEEFLIQINKKQRVDFRVEEHQIALDYGTDLNGESVAERQVNIVRNGWGYTRLYIECSGEFLFTEKDVLTDDDFLGNYCSLPVFVDGSKCRKGRSFGEICLYNFHVLLTVSVTVQREDGAAVRRAQLKQKQVRVQLMNSYLDFRNKKINAAGWLKESGTLVERMVARDENDAEARLFQAQMLITEERYNEAGWILDHVSELLEQQPHDEALTAYYLYLTTLIHRDGPYVERVSERVEQIYREDDTNWRAAWLLLYLSEDYRKSVPGKWRFLERQFEAGCSSPLLYMETVTLINNNPAALRKLGQFELQVLWYGTRRDLLKPEVTEQLLYLTGKVRDFQPVLYRILVALYGRKKDVRLLQEICTLLIKGGKSGRKYFAWYQAGVNAKLRITKLFEYYMLSLDMEKNQELPKTVLMYFSYQMNLDYERSAYLYDYVLQHGDRLGDMMDAYRPRMEQFVLEQIKKEHINRPLADLYNRLLRPGMVTKETSGPLSRLLFAHLIRVEDSRLRKVYVYQPGNERPAEYTLNGGRTWVALYGNEYTVVFEDSSRNRYISTAEYTIEKLMLPGKYLRLLMPYLEQNPELDLFLCTAEREETVQESVSRGLRVLESGLASPQLKRELYLRILKQYYDSDNLRALDEYLERVPGDELTMEERGEAVRYMVLRGKYELAGTWLREYGPYFVDPKVLVRLISPLIEKSGNMEDPLLTAAAACAFRRRKYDGTVLKYLSLYGRGMAKNLRDIWKAARDFDVDCYELSERILVQMLYSGAFVGEKMEIFHYYISQGPKPEVEEAFLAQCAYDYFVRERVTPADVFREIQNMYLRGEPVQRVCKLGMLKYYAEDPASLDGEGERLAGDFLKEFLSEGIHLEWFKAFRQFPWVQQELIDKTVVEYRAEPGSRACIHYVITNDSGESEEYVSEYMREVYGGVCFKEFVLFFGESLQYYITEEKEGGEARLTESGTLQKSDIRGDGSDSRYQLINDIVISRTMQDLDTMDDLLEEYYRKEFLNGRLFRLK